VHTLGDAHVYNNHIEPLKVQLSREPMPFPTIEFKRKVDDIEDFLGSILRSSDSAKNTLDKFSSSLRPKITSINLLCTGIKQ
jgi:hypothetical protein